jgi:hypothetical protein
VMTRVCGLLVLVDRPDDPEFLLALLSCRKRCSRDEGARTKWIECYSMVSTFTSLSIERSDA